jgi:hypothetical protein
MKPVHDRRDPPADLKIGQAHLPQRSAEVREPVGESTPLTIHDAGASFQDTGTFGAELRKLVRDTRRDHVKFASSVVPFDVFELPSPPAAKFTLGQQFIYVKTPAGGQVGRLGIDETGEVVAVHYDSKVELKQLLEQLSEQNPVFAEIAKRFPGPVDVAKRPPGPVGNADPPSAPVSPGPRPPSAELQAFLAEARGSVSTAMREAQGVSPSTSMEKLLALSRQLAQERVDESRRLMELQPDAGRWPHTYTDATQPRAAAMVRLAGEMLNRVGQDPESDRALAVSIEAGHPSMGCLLLAAAPQAHPELNRSEEQLWREPMPPGQLARLAPLVPTLCSLIERGKAKMTVGFDGEQLLTLIGSNDAARYLSDELREICAERGFPQIGHYYTLVGAAAARYRDEPTPDNLALLLKATEPDRLVDLQRANGMSSSIDHKAALGMLAIAVDDGAEHSRRLEEMRDRIHSLLVQPSSDSLYPYAQPPANLVPAGHERALRPDVARDDALPEAIQLLGALGDVAAAVDVLKWYTSRMLNGGDVRPLESFRRHVGLERLGEEQRARIKGQLQWLAEQPMPEAYRKVLEDEASHW